MKKILSLTAAFVFLTSAVLNAQLQRNPKDSSLFMEEVVQVEGIAKEALFSRGKEWLVRNMKSSDEQVFLDDEEKNSITGTGNLLLKDYHHEDGYTYTNRVINFKISIFFKEGRYKYVVENIIFHHVVKTPTTRDPQTFSVEELMQWIADLEAIPEEDRKKKLWKRVHQKRLANNKIRRQEIDKAMVNLSKDLKTSMESPAEADKDDW